MDDKKRPVKGRPRKNTGGKGTESAKALRCWRNVSGPGMEGLWTWVMGVGETWGGAQPEQISRKPLLACRGLWVFLCLVESQRWMYTEEGWQGQIEHSADPLIAACELADASTTPYNCHSFLWQEHLRSAFSTLCLTVLLTINVILGCNTVVDCKRNTVLISLVRPTYPWTYSQPFDKRFPFPPLPAPGKLPFHSVSTSWNFYIPPRSDILYINKTSVSFFVWVISPA